MQNYLVHLLNKNNITVSDQIDFMPYQIVLNNDTILFQFVHVLQDGNMLLKDPIEIVYTDTHVKFSKPFVFSDDRVVPFRNHNVSFIVSLTDKWVEDYKKFIHQLYDKVDNQPDDEEPLVKTDTVAKQIH